MGASCSCLNTEEASVPKEDDQPLEVIAIMALGPVLCRCTRPPT